MTTTLTSKVKVRNLISKSGREIPNQFEIRVNGCKYFQSYNSIIVKIDENNQVYLDSYYWDYSNTTRKWLYNWLGGGLRKKDILARIKSGLYKTADLQQDY